MNLLQRILDMKNLESAWEHVESNRGGPGIDRMTVEDFSDNLRENLVFIQSKALNKEYRPGPVRDIEIDKPTGGTRTISLLCVRDKVLLQAIAQVFNRIFDPLFLDCSFAYRKHKSALQAADQINRLIQAGQVWVFESDIERFFDSIHHDILLRSIDNEIMDRDVILLVKQFLTSTHTNDQVSYIPSVGISLGSPLSPILANIYLTPFDTMMSQFGFFLIRYADDFVVLGKTRAEVELAQRKTIEMMSELKLRLSEKKTHILHCSDGFDFLGFHFTEEGRGPSRSAQNSLTVRLQSALEDASDKSNPEKMDDLCAVLRGWRQYFHSLPRGLDALPLIVQAARIKDCMEDKNSVEVSRLLRMIRRQTDSGAEIHCMIGDYLRNQKRAGLAWCEFITALLCPDCREDEMTMCLHALQLGSDEWENIREEVTALWTQLDDVETWRNLAELFAEQRCFNQAKWFDAYARTSKFSDTIPEESSDASPATTVIDKEYVFDPDAVPDSAKQLFLTLFHGRENQFAREWVDSEGRRGFTPVNQPLTMERLNEHLHGQATYAVYLHRSNGTVMFGVIDVDVGKKDIVLREEEGREWSDLILKAHEDAVKLYAAAQYFKIPALIEDSGYKGRHVWIFFNEPILPASVVPLLQGIAEKAGKPEPEIRREFFPQSRKVKSGNPGALIKLPWGKHSISGKYALFLQPDGRCADQAAVLENIKPLKASRFASILAGMTTVSHSRQGENVKKIDVPISDLKDIPPRGPIRRIFKGCALMRYLTHKAQATGFLRHTERVAILYSLVHIGPEGAEMIHKIISYCVNYDPDYTQRRIDKVKPSPISCNRLQETLPQTTAALNCHCHFKLRGTGRYPSPVLHAGETALSAMHTWGVSSSKTSASTPPEPEPKGSEVDQAVKKLIELKRQYRGVLKGIKKIEERLEQLMDAAGTDRLETHQGFLVRRKNDAGETIWTIEI